MTCDTVDMSFLARAWRCWRTLWKGKIRRSVNVGADCGFSNSRPLSFPQQCMAFIMDNNVLFCVCVGGARPISSMNELACHAVKIPAAPCLYDPQNYPSFYSTFVFFFHLFYNIDIFWAYLCVLYQQTKQQIFVIQLVEWIPPCNFLVLESKVISGKRFNCSRNNNVLLLFATLWMSDQYTGKSNISVHILKCVQNSSAHFSHSQIQYVKCHYII